MGDIFAGIVLYNPDLVRLSENITSISGQVSQIIVVDNGSNNQIENRKIVQSFSNTIYIELKENEGIAAALNVIANKCESEGAEWVLTLDQDTVCNKDIIDNYAPYLGLQNVGQLSCLYHDRNFVNSKSNGSEFDGAKEVDWCITSASLLNIKAWRKVGMFDERLFIDQVDYDICMTMREHGYRIYQLGFIGFLHEIGQGCEKKIGLFNIRTWNHSPFRRYYGVRNAIIVAGKHKELNVPRATLGALKHIAIIFMFENDKFSKLVAGFRGLKDGFRVLSSDKRQRKVKE